MKKREDIHLINCKKIIHALEDHRLKNGITKFKIAYFGGEPTLNWKSLTELDDYFIHHKDCVERYMPSNFIEITESMARYIKTHNLKTAWSFDGMGSPMSRFQYDLQFEDIWNHFIYNHKQYVALSNNVNTVIDNINVSSIIQSYELFAYKFNLDVFGFTFVKDDVWTEDTVKIYKDQMNVITDLYISDFKKGKRFILSNIIQTFYMFNRKYSSFGCDFVESGKSVCIYPDGSFYPCARFGTNNDAELNIIDKPIFDKCSTCKYLGYCNVKCLCNYLIKTNSLSPFVCELLDCDVKCCQKVIDEFKNDPSFKKFLIDNYHYYNFISSGE